MPEVCLFPSICTLQHALDSASVGLQVSLCDISKFPWDRTDIHTTV